MITHHGMRHDPVDQDHIPSPRSSNRCSRHSEPMPTRRHRNDSLPNKPLIRHTPPSPMTRPCNLEIRTHFGRLLRTSPPALPDHLWPISDEFKTRHRGRASSSGNGVTTSGKVKVILYIHHAGQSSGNALTASAALNAIGGHYLPPGHPLHNLTPDRDGTGTSTSDPCITWDPRRKQVTLRDPVPQRRRTAPVGPKRFGFDAVLTRTDPKMELCAVTLGESIQAVLLGQDSCVLTFGHKQTGKTSSMLGHSNDPSNLGIIPCAISWLYRLLNQQKEKSGVRFSVRISAVEIYGTDEKFRDLLAGVVSDADGDTPQSPCLPFGQPSRTCSDTENPHTHSHSSGDASADNVASRVADCLNRQTELRASSAEKAAHFLDCALANRTCFQVTNMEAAQRPGLSHMLFTLHVYQCRVEQGDVGVNVSGGRTRLRFLDLGCGRYNHSVSLSEAKTSPLVNGGSAVQQTRPPNSCIVGLTQSKSLSISAMANVLLALLTGQRHLPFRDSALTHMIKEALTGSHIHPCLIVHVAAGAQYYSETLQVIQFASKLNRLRRRRIGLASNSDASGQSAGQGGFEDAASSSVESFSDHTCSSAGRQFRKRFRGPRLGRSSYARSISSFSSELDFSSSSEQSCDTVIYTGLTPSLIGEGRIGERMCVSGLGPRGMADGSVDARSISSGQLSSSDLPQAKKYHSSTTESGNGGGSSGATKRMIPRTNATVWPKPILARKTREHIQSETETWVDGPNAFEVPSMDSQSSRLESSDLKKRGPSIQCPSVQMTNGLSNDTGHHLSNSDAPSEKEHNPACTNDREWGNDQFTPSTSVPGIPTSSTELFDQNKWSQDTGTNQLSLSAPNANTDREPEVNEANLGPRALSDISEHTEDTETVPDCNTFKSTSASDPIDCLSLLNMDSLPRTSWEYQPFSLTPPNDGNGETGVPVVSPRTDEAICNLRRQIWEATVEVEGSSRDPPRMGKEWSDLFRLCSSPSDHSPLTLMSLSELQTRERTPEYDNRQEQQQKREQEQEQLDYSPLKLLNESFPYGDRDRKKTEEQLFLNGCGEQVVSAESFNSCRTNSPTTRPSMTDWSVNNNKSFRTQSMDRVESQSGDCVKPQTGSANKDRVPVRTESRQSNGTETSFASIHNPLLRVAAWVNSIDNAGQCHTTSVQSSEMVDVVSAEWNKTSPKVRGNMAPCPMSNRLAPTVGRENRRNESPGTRHPTDCGSSTKAINSIMTFPETSLNEQSNNCPGSSPTQTMQHLGSSSYRPMLPYKPQSPNLPIIHTPSDVNSPPLGYYYHYYQQPQQPQHLSQMRSREFPTSSSFNPMSTHPMPTYPMERKQCKPTTSTKPVSLYRHELTENRPLPSQGHEQHELDTRQTIPRSPPPPPPPPHTSDSVAVSLEYGGESRPKEIIKSPKAFRFLTLPIFRSLRLRRGGKEKSKLLGNTIENVPITSPSVTTVGGNDDNDEGNRCQTDGSVVSSGICCTHSSSLTSFGKSHRKSAPLQCQPVPPEVKPTETRSHGGSQRWAIDPRSICNNQEQQYGSPVHVVEYQALLEKMESGRLGNLSISPTPLNALSYTSNPFTMVNRSGRRSVTGGAASSGYESMRIGTSELSLSHPDSASDCSGKLGGPVTSTTLWKDYSRQGAASVYVDAQRLRRHSSTTPNRHGSSSIGSMVSNPTLQPTMTSDHCYSRHSYNVQTGSLVNGFIGAIPSPYVRATGMYATKTDSHATGRAN